MQGDLLYAEGAIIEDTNNIETEAIAILYALKHYNQSKYVKEIIQIDSLSMQNILNKEWESP